MSIYDYLELQPVEPTEDGSISDLDQHATDEVIDLTGDADGESLMQEWDKMITELHDDPDKLSFSEEE